MTWTRCWTRMLRGARGGGLVLAQNEGHLSAEPGGDRHRGELVDGEIRDVGDRLEPVGAEGVGDATAHPPRRGRCARTRASRTRPGSRGWASRRRPRRRPRSSRRRASMARPAGTPPRAADDTRARDVRRTPPTSTDARARRAKQRHPAVAASQDLSCAAVRSASAGRTHGRMTHDGEQKRGLVVFRQQRDDGAREPGETRNPRGDLVYLGNAEETLVNLGDVRATRQIVFDKIPRSALFHARTWCDKTCARESNVSSLRRVPVVFVVLVTLRLADDTSLLSSLAYASSPRSCCL